MNITFQNLGTVNKNTIILTDEKGWKKLQLWFSYETCVAFDHASCGLKVRQNDWSVTTGKLLNELEPDKSKRVEGKKFELMLSRFLIKLDTVPNFDSEDLK